MDMRRAMIFGGLCCAAGGAFAAHGFGDAMAPTGREWEQEQNLSDNKEPARAWAFSFTDLDSAKQILPWFSARWQSLDSKTEWKFKWSKDPASRPVGFQEPSYDVSGWDTIDVPLSWQMAGYGTPVYSNEIYPFKIDPPRVTSTPPRDWTSFTERPSVGSYRRTFTLPDGFSKGKVYLRFDGVEAAYYVWVNDTYIGYGEDSFTAGEYDITKALKDGENTISVEVYR